MAAKTGKRGAASGGMFGCCRVDAVVNVDARGQMVLPKEFRQRVGIRAGDKLALVSVQQAGETYCFMLVKAERLGAMAKDLLGRLGEGDQT